MSGILLLFNINHINVCEGDADADLIFIITGIIIFIITVYCYERLVTPKIMPPTAAMGIVNES